MPKIDGLEAAKEIRTFDKKAKIIFLTAFEGPEILKEASQYDIFDYIVKTAPMEKIMSVIQEALK
jgi:DNA-binding NarL/FixJ family response regulator